MIFGAGPKLIPALVLTNLWTLVLLFLAWNHNARHEVDQSVRDVDELLGAPPDGVKWSEMGEDPLSPVHHKPKPSEVDKGKGVGVATAILPVSTGWVPDLPTFCPECGEGDLLCAKYGLVLRSV